MDLREERKHRIASFMNDDAYKPLLLKELLTVLDVPKEEVDEFTGIVEELETEGKIFKTNKERYGIPDRMSLVVGRLQGKERGFGFVIPDDETLKDVFISADSLNGAMNNDRVVARVNKKSSTDSRAEGEIIRIIKRGNLEIVGTFESSKYFGFVVPDDKRITGDVFIPKDEFNGAVPGQKVVAELIKWPEKRRNAEGKIIEIIGNKDDAGTDILSIIRTYNLSEEFPEDVIKQAEGISETVTEEMYKGRRDLKNLTMVTIDGEDAKDLDDAVSVELLPDGNYRLGVHIADVTHYVTEGSPLDEEALKRGTSVYLVDRVIPMLPRKLSNGICSLNPKIDRLAFTVMMDIDHTGKVVNHEIFESVINIDERMTYTNVFKILVEHDEELIERYRPLIKFFETMEELSLILKNKRIVRGAIDFDFEEAKIKLDENGKPIDIKPYPITIANKIIEEFMLVCNETVAEHFFWANSPFVYRVHEDPDVEKIQNFAEFASSLGYHLKGLNKIHPKAMQELLAKVKGTREERIIGTVMLRSLAKARYSQENAGHFGLAAKFYSHFTSPIRRYPDLMIHRIMKEWLAGEMNEKRQDEYHRKLPEIARQCSERERGAEEAERETEDLKKVEYMKAHEGEVFEGIISNVTSFGMFIELENTIEGLVKMSNMEDDYYIFNDKLYCLVGERTRKTYRIGDNVRVKLARADIASRQIDFVLVKEKTAGTEGASNTNKELGQKPKRARKSKGNKEVLDHVKGKRTRTGASKKPAQGAKGFNKGSKPEAKRKNGTGNFGKKKTDINKEGESRGNIKANGENSKKAETQTETPKS